MKLLASIPLRPATVTAPLLFYAVILFFVYLADSIMSYVAPIYIDALVADTLVMGLILASSSAMGIVCDSLFPSILQTKHHSFFIWTTICFAMLFPAIFILYPQYVGMIVVAMLVWGVYFELLMFANSYFIEAYMAHEHHGLAWGVINTFRSSSMFLSPLLTPLLLDKATQYPLFLAVFLLGVALVGVGLFKHLFPHERHLLTTKLVLTRRTFHQELRIWRTIFHKVWPLYLFLFSIVCLEATMMSIGVLATEDLRTKSMIGALFLAVFILPNMFTGFFVQPLGKILGKKALAFLAGAIGGGLLAVATQLSSTEYMVGLTLLAACFTSLAYPAALATMQDYTSRLGSSFGREMIGMTSSAGSLAYILGPILAGAINRSAGHFTTITIMAMLLMIVSLICIGVVSRKVRMPQHILQTLT